MKKAVIYARYSCDAQTEQSIEGQLRVCREYAERNDILIVDTYIDRAMTGTNDLRPDFRRMIEDSAKREWTVVLVYKLDRFSRDKYASTVHKHTLKQNGVKVVSAMENIPDTPEGIILEALLEGMNQYYSAELSQKVMRGMKETRQKGNFQGGHIPYGYRVEGKKVVIDDEKAEVVRYIFTEYAKGTYVREIIETLTAKGFTYHNKPFAMNTVYGILKNEKYSGSYMLRDELVDKIYPQIIPTEIYTHVREKIQSNRYGRRSVQVKYLLRKKMKCGYCGQTMVAESGTAKAGKVSHYYKCHGRKNLRNGCTQATFRKEAIEKVVLDSIIKELEKPDQIDYITKELLQLQKEKNKGNSLLAIYEKEQKQNETALGNIMTAVENGIFSATTNKRLRELEERQLELERLITTEKCKADIEIPASEIRKFYAKALEMEPTLLIDYLVKEIVVFNDEMHIYYNSPIETKSPDESQGFLLCEETENLTIYIQTTGVVDSKSMTVLIKI